MGEWQIFHLEGESEFARPGQTGKIGSQPVAQIHHCVDREILRKPSRLHDPWDEVQMLLSHGTSESAGNEKIITCLAAAPGNPSFSLHESSDADGDGNRPMRAACFAADDADFEPLRRPAQAAIKFFYPRHLRSVRGHKRAQRERRE